MKKSEYGKLDLNFLRICEEFFPHDYDDPQFANMPKGRYLSFDGLYGLENEIFPVLSGLTFDFSIPLSEGETPIEELLSLQKGFIKKGGGIDSFFVMGKQCSEDEYEETICSFIVNFLLYSSSPNADKVSMNESKIRRLKKGKVTGQVKRKIQALRQAPEWIVGSKVVVDSRLKQIAQSPGSEKYYQKAVNVLVRGHWRHVWHGKKTEESPKGEGRRPVWVQPFVRNKATGAVLGHQYEVR